MTALKFSTKAGTLETLREHIKSAKILPLERFRVAEFIQKKETILQNLQAGFEEKLLIVRSSALDEDGLNFSNAGSFESVANVERTDANALRAAVETVVNSYEKDNGANEVLVQPMLSDVRYCGVVFTVDADTLAPYYIVNFDDSGSTDSVTSGAASKLKTFVYFKNAGNPPENPALAKLIETCKEIEELFDYRYLDIEFGITSDDEVYIFQVRPIAVQKKEDLSHIKLDTPLRKLHSKIRKLSRPHPYLLGKRAVFGVMPDWNPAEIIGFRPRQLAVSLYKELITDNIWAYQRDNYGYRNLRSHPLLISFLGIPYIDVRVSFNSFVPKSLNEDIAEKLVNFYLDKLVNTPAYHDKVEFEIVYSCYFFNLPERLKELLDAGFNENEIKRVEFALLDLTNSIINPENGLFKKDLEKIGTLEEKYQTIANSKLSTLEKIYWLIEDCKRYGTLPFAGIARSAFVAVQFLKSFVSAGLMTKTEYDAFMSSLNTVSKRLNRDLEKLSRERLSREDFLTTYGHLRPGTYDVLSPRYDEDFENYFSDRPNNHVEESTFEFREEQVRQIERSLAENGIHASFESLIDFIRQSIEAREYSKFVFTRSLSQVIKLVENVGRRIGMSREALSYVDVKRILELYSTLDHRDVYDILVTDIQQNASFYEYTKAVKLPGLILQPDDIYRFYLDEDKPNFITLKRVEAPIVLEQDFNCKNMEGKIAFIQSADPGYDFLFTKNITGLVTQFGGANSHMAIRCAELGIPAVIGAGENYFVNWSKAKVLEIDCSSNLVRIIH